MKNFHVLPIYGGQAYSHQLKPLKKGVHVIVGTPGRVIDHIKRKTLQLKSIKKTLLAIHFPDPKLGSLTIQSLKKYPRKHSSSRGRESKRCYR